MAMNLKDYQSNAVGGLDTWTYVVPVAGPYFVDLKSTMVPASGLSAAIKLNGSDAATASVQSSTQQILNLSAQFLSLSVNDTITIVLTSSQSDPTDNDILANQLRSIIVVSAGLGQ